MIHEQFPEALTEPIALTGDSGDSSTLEITELLRNDDAGVAAMHSVRRLMQVVAEWSPRVGLDITFSSHEGRRTLQFAKHGDTQPGWASDVSWALEHSAALAPARENASSGYQPAWGSVMEIHPTRNLKPGLTGFVAPPEPDAEGPRHLDPGQFELLQNRLRSRLRTPWPTPLSDSLRSTAALLGEHPDLLVRFRISAATDPEIDMLTETMLHTWTGSDGDLYPYLGRPVRLRTLLASRSGTVPARAIAISRRWALGLSATPVDPARAADVWGGGVASLYGFTTPEGVALGLLRLPAAGQAPFPGLPTKHPRLKLCPLDPLPAAPANPIRLGTAVSVTDEPVEASLDAEDLRRHMFVEGQSGSGKSTLIAALAREVISKGYGCTFLDPHGSTIDLILRELPPGARDSFVVRHQDAEHPVPLNIMTGSIEETEIIVDDFAEMVQEMYDPKNSGIVGPRWRRWFGLLAQATRIVMGPAASLVAVTQIGTDVRLSKKLAEAVAQHDRSLSHAIMTEIVNNRSTEAADIQAWCVSKLQPIIQTRMMRARLGTGRDAVDVGQLMDEGKSLLVDLATPTLGIPGSRLLGALWLLKHQMAMGRRKTQRPHVLIVDEAHLFQYGSLPKLLSEGRKFGIGVVVATQYLGQLREDLQESLEANAGSLISLSTGLKHAARASVRLGGWPVEDLVRLPSLTAAASLSRDGTRTEPFSLVIDHHEQMESSGVRDSVESQEIAEHVVSQSRRVLWEQHREQPPYDAARIDRFLTLAVERAKSGPEPRSTPGSSFMEEWLARRHMSQASTAPVGAVDPALPTDDEVTKPGTFSP